MRAEAKLAKAATKAEASATPKDDMSAPIGAASNVEGGCARRAPDLEASSVAIGAPVPLDDGVQVKAEPGTRGVVGAPVPPGDGVQVKMEPGTRRNEGPPVSGDEVIFLESTDDEGCPELIGEQG